MDDDGIRIRPLVAGDWDEVVALEAHAYADDGLSEGRAALQSRHRASPDTCSVLEHRGRFGGYLLALPYPLGRCPDLTRAEPTAGPAAPANLHAHDLVVHQELRGRGLGPRFLGHLVSAARERGYATVSLVAVRGSEVVWAPLGFRARPEVVLPDGYGPRALYMALELHPA